MNKVIFGGVLAGASVLIPALAEAADCRAWPNRPDATIGACMEQARAGDVIKVSAGYYTDRRSGGQESLPIVLKAGVTLQGEGPTTTVLANRGNHVLVGDLAGATLEGISLVADYAEVINLSTEQDGAHFRMRFVHAAANGGAWKAAMGVRLDAAAASNASVQIESSRITTSGGNGLLELVDIETLRIDDSTLEPGKGAPRLQGVVLTSMKPGAHTVAIRDSRIEYGDGVALRINNTALQASAYDIDLAGLETGESTVQAYGPVAAYLPPGLEVNTQTLMSGDLWLRASEVGPLSVRGLDLHLVDVDQVSVAANNRR